MNLGVVKPQMVVPWPNVVEVRRHIMAEVRDRYGGIPYLALGMLMTGIATSLFVHEAPRDREAAHSPKDFNLQGPVCPAIGASLGGLGVWHMTLTSKDELVYLRPNRQYCGGSSLVH